MQRFSTLVHQSKGRSLVPLSDSGKMKSANAHQRADGPSTPMEHIERLTAGSVTDPASRNDGDQRRTRRDARQAAAAKTRGRARTGAQGAGGDRLAFEELVRRYDREVLRLALNLVHRAEDARDIYQESFLRVYRNLHRFRFECSFYTWLYRIVTNVALDHLRRRTSHKEDQAPCRMKTRKERRAISSTASRSERGSESGKESAGTGIGREDSGSDEDVFRRASEWFSK